MNFFKQSCFCPFDTCLSQLDEALDRIRRLETERDELAYRLDGILRGDREETGIFEVFVFFHTGKDLVILLG